MEDRDVSNLKPRLHIPSRTSSPCSAPTTPRLQTPRRPSYPSASPLQHADSPRHQLQQQQQPPLRRASSTMSSGTPRPGSRAGTPKMLERKTSRSSLKGEETDRRPTPKRSISNLITTLREAHSSMDPIEEPIPLTAPQIAMDHFARELLAHGSMTAAAADTVVILHDACYGHRFSRLKTSKGALSMIVERPERIHASVLGASMAYVKLGGHHNGASNAPHPAKLQTVPPPFRIRKSARTLDITSSYVTNVHGTGWMAELKTMCGAASERLAAGVKELQRDATSEAQHLHEGDLYLASQSLDAFQGALGGVADAVDSVFQPSSATSRAFVAVRPPGHHCSADQPSGFCWLNNVHVGIEYAAQTYNLTHAAIIDFDLHHGDGSQAITWERNSQNNQKRLNAKPNSKLKLGPEIGYYSLHDINSYPCEYGDDGKVQAASLCIDNAHSQSVWNVHLQPWKTDEEFWSLYENQYRVLLDKARIFLRHHTASFQADGKVTPKAAIFISAGFDASEWESVGMQRHKVNVPTEFYARFTRDMVQLALEEGTSCDGRVISVLEGGYSDRALCSGVLSHLSGLCASPITQAHEQQPPQPAGIGLDQMMRGLRINGVSSTTTFSYDKKWWSDASLTALELEVNPPVPVQGKKVRTGPQPTYATPTESFAYKVVDTNKFARSISGTMREGVVPARPATPPPPEVNWVVATQELSKLLIPIDRQTKSFTAEDLAAVRPKKDRASMMPMLPAGDAVNSRQMRTRNSKAPVYPESTYSDELDSVRSVSQASNRRQTLHDFPITPAHPAIEKPVQQRKFSRRLSAGSALGDPNAFDTSRAPPMPKLPAKNLPTTNRSSKPPPVSAPIGMQAKKIRPRKPAALSSTPTSPKTSGAVALTSDQPTESTSKRTDIEALTSGMKKVTLKLGTREEHDRKQKEKDAAERRTRALKGAETRRINAAAKKAATTNPNGQATQIVQAPQILPAPLPSIGRVAPQNPWADSGDPFIAGPNAQASVQTSAMPVLADPLDIGPLPIPAPALPETLQHPSFTDFPDSVGRQLLQQYAIANGMAPLIDVPSLPSVASLPMETAAPQIPHHTSRLPIWSSTGAIPFAAPTAHEPPSATMSSTFQPHSSGVKAQIPHEEEINVSENIDAYSEVKSEAATEAAEIWDIPDTPGR